ncbi:MAG: hypothetical protein RIT81_47035 [Deltaproteobacteria bacterium]
MKWALGTLLVASVACKADPAPPVRGAPDAGVRIIGYELPPTRDDTRFIKIRNLLREPPESTNRATKLYPLVRPVCVDEQERKEFLEVAKWSTSFSSEENYLPTQLAIDTIEHVATACFRSDPEGALALLTGAEAFVQSPRLDVIRARLLAAREDFAEAEKAARRALEGGSVHAIALTANIQAQRARAASDGYTPGMLDDAIKTVSVEPNSKWAVIDLTAVLATHARLLGERAVWESGETQKKTLLEAAGLYQRLSVAPFIAAIRNRALDNLCYDADRLPKSEACARAARETQNLGAAKKADVTLDPGFDTKRLAGLTSMTSTLAQLDEGAVVLWVARGDESELLEWVRPASDILRKIAKTKPRIIVVDRTSTPRASRLVTRMFELAGVTATRRIDAQRDTFAMPCITAILADRRTPKACPLDAETKTALEKARPFGVGVLVGRDLDGELDDLRLYDLPSLLLSFRRSLSKKGPTAWLKSVSDVHLFAP